ncbi:hypothetical protein CKO28_22765 [Rhodovibrio sodomensis]|uniref:Uncharacterized protein n=1 Tax=Rhodovibrio sodomensis TaxID=1088 RepID=A0ABS1DL66_9PROT|nr:hypothetical protein [Rhodovibrio sodomensis]MBK1670843.1 hypothetical protein [Rhodovibrio sodomensis]
MTTIHKAAGAKRAGAALMLALLLAGTSLPALAAGQSGDRDAGDRQAAGGDMGGSEMSVQEAWANAREDWNQLQDASGDALSAARKQFQQSWNRLQSLMSEQEGTAPPPDDPAVLQQRTNGE